MACSYAITTSSRRQRGQKSREGGGRIAAPRPVPWLPTAAKVRAQSRGAVGLHAGASAALNRGETRTATAHGRPRRGPTFG